jgi:hypothetical protein
MTAVVAVAKQKTANIASSTMLTSVMRRAFSTKTVGVVGAGNVWELHCISRASSGLASCITQISFHRNHAMDPILVHVQVKWVRELHWWLRPMPNAKYW